MNTGVTIYQGISVFGKDSIIKSITTGMTTYRDQLCALVHEPDRKAYNIYIFSNDFKDT